MKTVTVCSLLVQLSLVNCRSITVSSQSAQQQYYMDLITQANANALQYEFPTSSSDFAYDATKAPQDWGVTYDFIIVGAGIAGAALADRLAQVYDWNIMLIEAGSPGNNMTNIPAMLPQDQLSSYNWGYKTIPQTTCCLGYKNSQCNYARGKALGGTSTINGLVYTKCNPYDYDKLALAGNIGWGYADVRKYLDIPENAYLPKSEYWYHGHTGPVHVEYSGGLTPATGSFLNACTQLNRNIVDYNGQSQYGAAIAQLMTDKGVRVSSENAYLKDTCGLIQRNNLDIVTQALATKVLTNTINNKPNAYGVTFIKNGILYKANATREVILSAGAINTPQLLILSGIGPMPVLQQFNIPQVKILPVGYNLHDHPRTTALPFTHNLTCDMSLEDSVALYLQNGTGPLASTGFLALNFISSIRNLNVLRPDIEHGFFDQNVTDLFYTLTQKTSGFNDETAFSAMGLVKNRCMWQISSFLLHPISRGSVTIKSTNPLEFPLIDFNWFTDLFQWDLETLVDAIEDVLRLVKTPAFQAINSVFRGLPLPACLAYPFMSRDYWRCHVKQTSYTADHAGGTCKMGPASDPGAVVDNFLRVYGVSNLRVVDGSIIPEPLSGHPSGPIYMIAEKIADAIRAFYNK